MLTIPFAIACGAVSVGVFVWRKIVVPFDRLLQQSEELEHPGWETNPDRSLSPIRAVKAPESITASLVNLAQALEPPSTPRQNAVDSETPPAATPATVAKVA